MSGFLENNPFCMYRVENFLENFKISNHWWRNWRSNKCFSFYQNQSYWTYWNKAPKSLDISRTDQDVWKTTHSPFNEYSPAPNNESFWGLLPKSNFQASELKITGRLNINRGLRMENIKSLPFLFGTREYYLGSYRYF